MRFKPSSLGLGLEDARHDENALILIPVAFKRCGLAMRLIVDPMTARKSKKSDMTMLTLLVKANDWFDRLARGECRSMTDIAQEEGAIIPYISRVIQLAFLSPEFQQRILLGQYPPELNGKQLLKKIPLPLDWTEQAKVLGIKL